MYRVLLVEDEKIELDTLRDYINWDKISVNKVYTARNGRSALECIEQNEPDIMITDIQMPVMNGIELAKRVREGSRIAAAMLCQRIVDGKRMQGNRGQAYLGI